MPDPTPSSTESDFRCGYIAIVGWPNVGKSTLMNALLGTKLSIVSPKPQTTRSAILGIVNEPRAQLIFVDTPGWLRPADEFQSSMKRVIVRSLHDDADVVLWLVEPKLLSDEEKAFAQKLIGLGKPLIVCLNKVDSIQIRATLDPLQNDLEKLFEGRGDVFRISAKSGQGLPSLRQKLVEKLPLAPPFFPTDQMTDRWERFYAAELIREAVFHLYQQEIPHACAVQVTDFIEIPGRKDHVQARLVVETEGQKKILIGRQGRQIKELGQRARASIEKMLGRPIFLELVVKVRKNWRKDSLFLKELETDYF